MEIMKDVPLKVILYTLIILYTLTFDLFKLLKSCNKYIYQ